MYFDIKPRAIDIQLNKGSYYFWPESAAGKTYLFGLLQKLGEYGIVKSCVITYIKDRDSEDIIRILQKEPYDIICLDRYDLYATESIGRVIGEKEESTLILMDMKDCRNIQYFAPTPADLEIFIDRIEVS